MTNVGGPIMSNPETVYNDWYRVGAWRGNTAEETNGTVELTFLKQMRLVPKFGMSLVR